MSLIFISEYNQTYCKHTSCYYCLGLTLCYEWNPKTSLKVKHLIFRILAEVIQGAHCGSGLEKRAQRQQLSGFSVGVRAVQGKIPLGCIQELRNLSLGSTSMQRVENVEGRINWLFNSIQYGFISKILKLYNFCNKYWKQQIMSRQVKSNVLQCHQLQYNNSV